MVHLLQDPTIMHQVKDTQNSYKTYQFQKKNTLQGGTHKDERNKKCRFTMPNFHMERKNYAYKKEFPIPGCHFGQKKTQATWPNHQILSYPTLQSKEVNSPRAN